MKLELKHVLGFGTDITKIREELNENYEMIQLPHISLEIRKQALKKIQEDNDNPPPLILGFLIFGDKQIEFLFKMILKSLLKSVSEDVLIVNPLSVMVVEFTHSLANDDFSNFLSQAVTKFFRLHELEINGKVNDLLDAEIEQKPIPKQFQKWSTGFQQNDKYFDFFFAATLRQMPLLKINESLSYQKEIYEGDFLSFLEVILTDFKEIFEKKTIKVVKQWIKKEEIVDITFHEAPKANHQLTETEIKTILNSKMAFLKQVNLKQEPITSNEDYQYIYDLSYKLIVEKKKPTISRKVKLNGVSAAAIRYLFYSIKSKIFTKSRGIKPLFIEFIKSLFIEFENQELETISKNFSKKPKLYPL